MKKLFVKKIKSEYTLGESNIFLNPFSYLAIRENDDLISNVDNILIDGQLLVILLKVLGLKSVKRRSFDFSSIAHSVFSESIDNNKSIFLIGSTDDHINSATKKLRSKFTSINIVGCHHGYIFGTPAYNQLINSLCEINPDIVIVGMGSPLQEQFIVDLKESSWVGTSFTCGGFFHQSSKSLDYYPKIINHLNLRFLYRIYDEPKLIYRYFILYPIAVYKIIKDKFYHDI